MKSKPIPSAPGYSATSDGRIFGPKGERPQYSNGQYMTVLIGSKQTRVHRLVLEAFRRSPTPGEVGHHKDHDKTNNKISNLEWSTQSRNLILAAEAGHGSKVVRPVVATCLKTGKIREFTSIQAVKRSGFYVTSVYLCCTGRMKTSANHTWRFK
jgi:hypothetical protein